PIIEGFPMGCKNHLRLPCKNHLRLPVVLQSDWVEGYVVGIQVDTARGVLFAGADPRGEQATLLPAYAIGW
ncbi:hypothetical protein, partial [Candidatus Entotheonella palauensis]|uniref:hypothetical protein n=1 Tax=Candidatus Entotheonella palauensis TaxID=93172 RepID=UPI001C4E125B